MKKHTYLLFLGSLAASVCHADDGNGNHAVWGIGQSSCNGYNQARKAGNINDYKNYLMGYLTAYNTLIPETYNVTGKTDLNGVLAWLDDYCGKTAMDSFDRALNLMVTEMHGKRAKTPPAAKAWGG